MYEVVIIVVIVVVTVSSSEEWMHIVTVSVPDRERK